MKEIKKAIKSWIDKNKGEVCFVGSFVSFDKKGDVKKDAMYMAFGVKDCVKVSLEEILKEVKKEKKGEFINW